MKLEEGKQYRIKHTRITEGKIIKIHKSMEGKPVLYDVEYDFGEIRRIPPYSILDSKDVTDGE